MSIFEIQVTTRNDVTALLGNATASSKEYCPPDYAIDGVDNTRWISDSDSGMPQWYQIDWNQTQQLNSITIVFQDYAEDYTIQTWNGLNWATQRNVTDNNNDSLTRQYTFPKVSTTKLLITFTRADACKQVSMWEIKTNTLDNAAKRTATASSYRWLKPDYAIDGNPDTRWASNRSMPQWYQIEWNQTQNLTSIKIVFETAYANDYTIQTWNENNWTNQITVENNTSPNPEEYNFTQPTPTTKLLITFTRADLFGQVSVYEIQITTQNNGAPTMALIGNASASSYEAGSAPELAIDGNPDTRWASNRSMPQWYQINWGNQKQQLYKIKINFQDAYANDYTIQTWNENNWTNQITVENNTSLNPEYAFIEITNTTKLLINFTKAMPSNQVSIRELQITTRNDATAPIGNASASTTEDDNKPELAIDGDYNTRWASNRSMPQWYQIEWNQTQNLTSIKIVFETAYANDYIIQTWNGLNWETQITVTDNNNDSLTRQYTFPEVIPTTKLNITFTKAEYWGLVSIRELQITTRNDATAPIGNASASTTEDPARTPELAIDGNPDTRWASNRSMPQWYQINWGNQTQQLSSVKINFTSAYANDYTIQTWNENNWTNQITVENNTSPNPEEYNFTQPTPTTKLLINFTRAPLNQVSIYEIQITTRNDATPKFLGMLGIKNLLVENNIVEGTLSDAKDLGVLEKNPEFSLTQKWDGASLYENAYVQAKLYSANNIFNFSDVSDMYQLIGDNAWSTLQHSAFVKLTSNTDWTTLGTLQTPEGFSWTELSPTSYKITVKANAPFLLDVLRKLRLTLEGIRQRRANPRKQSLRRSERLRQRLACEQHRKPHHNGGV